MRNAKIRILFLSLILGITGTCILTKELPDIYPSKMNQQVWWGGMYPEYCLPGAMELVEGEHVQGTEEIPVKICFKYLTFLNETGG